MLNKISVKIEKMGIAKVIRKSFKRNNENISTVSAYANNQLYYRSWLLDKRKITKCYHNGKLISCSKVNLEV